MAASALDPEPALSEAYLRALAAAAPYPDTHAGSPLHFTVTAMHGVSHPYMVRAFQACGFKVSSAGRDNAVGRAKPGTRWDSAGLVTLLDIPSRFSGCPDCVLTDTAMYLTPPPPPDPRP